jgi:addiction module RelE/StbE family toxin
MLDSCKRDYLKLVKKNTMLRLWIENIFAELKLSPYIGERLFANFPGCRSIHFSGNGYRIIYKILDEPDSEILILDIGHRSSSYADLARILGQGK